MSTEHRLVLYAHLYQPPRYGFHERIRRIKTDPDGNDWTARINGECYSPLARMDLWSKISYGVYPTLFKALEELDPATASYMGSHLAENGAAGMFGHCLGPDLGYEDKVINVGAGILQFMRLAGKRPKIFWLPETAVDTDTLEVLTDFNIEGFFCASEQIQLPFGEPADNTLTKIKLPNNREIIGLPFDRPLSGALGFSPFRYDAFVFTENEVLPALGRLRHGDTIITATDGETFGHHHPWGGDFLEWLVKHALPKHQIRLVSVNSLDLREVKVEGQIKENTAWSCAHGLGRWQGECHCDAEGQDISWKKPLYTALRNANTEITALVKKRLDDYLQTMITKFEKGFVNQGPPDTDTELSLISAKVSAILALTSCATFFADPHKSGRINIVYARQAVEYLTDAGLFDQAAEIWQEFMGVMKEITDPTSPDKKLSEIIESFLGEATQLQRPRLLVAVA